MKKKGERNIAIFAEITHLLPKRASNKLTANSEIKPYVIEPTKKRNKISFLVLLNSFSAPNTVSNEAFIKTVAIEYEMTFMGISKKAQVKA